MVGVEGVFFYLRKRRLIFLSMQKQKNQFAITVALNLFYYHLYNYSVTFRHYNINIRRSVMALVFLCRGRAIILTKETAG